MNCSSPSCHYYFYNYFSCISTLYKFIQCFNWSGLFTAISDMDSGMQAEAKKIYWSIFSSFLHRLLISPSLCSSPPFSGCSCLPNRSNTSKFFKLSQGNCYFLKSLLTLLAFFFVMCVIDCIHFWIIDTGKVCYTDFIH